MIRHRLFNAPGITTFILMAGLTLLLAPLPTNAADEALPITTADPDVPTDELTLLVRPLTMDELAVEADTWLALLQAKVTEISACEIELKRGTRAAAETDTPTSTATTPQPANDEEAEGLVELRAQRQRLIDRLNIVLTAYETKGGDPSAYKTYISAVASFATDVDPTDVSLFWTTTRGWLTSKEGGIRWGTNIIYFLVTLLVFWILSRIAGNAVERALTMAKTASDLLKTFLVSFVRRIVMLTGLLVAITMLEISVGPVLAIVGAAGFVVAFALQGTLGNFASGIMILAYRPFDIGDAITAGGVSGVVHSMNLVSTVIHTFDNQRIIVPNNTVWGGVITNITGLPTRRVDLVFSIGYGDNMDKAAGILEELVKKHELVLDDPAPVVKVHELADSSVNLVCRPWAKTADYWNVYWDITKQAKERFDAEGISIPFPQRDVHMIPEGGPSA